MRGTKPVGAYPTMHQARRLVCSDKKHPSQDSQRLCRHNVAVLAGAVVGAAVVGIILVSIGATAMPTCLILTLTMNESFFRPKKAAVTAVSSGGSHLSHERECPQFQIVYD